MPANAPVGFATQGKARRAVLELRVPAAVAAPTAFAAITDWPAQHRWMLGTRVWVSRGSGRAAGDELSCFTGLGRWGVLDTMTITEFGEELVVVEHTGKVVRGIGWMGAAPGEGGAGSVLVWGEAVDLPLGVVGRAGWAAVGRPLLAAAVRYSLRKLARQIEAGGPAQG